MIHVIAVITAKPGQRDSLLTHFLSNVPAVKAERGCIEYGAAVDVVSDLPIQTPYGPDTFLVIEKWENIAALRDHSAAAHMIAYGAKTKDLVQSRVIHLLNPVE